MKKKTGDQRYALDNTIYSEVAVKRDLMIEDYDKEKLLSGETPEGID